MLGARQLLLEPNALAGAVLHDGFTFAHHQQKEQKQYQHDGGTGQDDPYLGAKDGFVFQ